MYATRNNPWFNPGPSFGPVPTLPRRATLRELEGHLDALTAEVLSASETARTSDSLTETGRDEWLSRTSEIREWPDRLQALTDRMTGALESAQERAESLRGGMTDHAGTVEERTLAELRLARRREAITRQLEADPLAAGQLVREANPIDLPILLELVRDTVGTDSPEGRAAEKVVETGLRERSLDYATAVEVAAKAAAARHVVTAKVNAAVEAMTNPHATPQRGSLAGKSVAIAGEAVAALEG